MYWFSGMNVVLEFQQAIAFRPRRAYNKIPSSVITSDVLWLVLASPEIVICLRSSLWLEASDIFLSTDTGREASRTLAKLWKYNLRSTSYCEPSRFKLRENYAESQVACQVQRIRGWGSWPNSSQMVKMRAFFRLQIVQESRSLSTILWLEKSLES